MACHLFSAKPLFKPMLTSPDPDLMWIGTLRKSLEKQSTKMSFWKTYFKLSSAKCGPFITYLIKLMATSEEQNKTIVVLMEVLFWLIASECRGSHWSCRFHWWTSEVYSGGTEFLMLVCVYISVCWMVLWLWKTWLSSCWSTLLAFWRLVWYTR